MIQLSPNSTEMPPIFQRVKRFLGRDIYLERQASGAECYTVLMRPTDSHWRHYKDLNAAMKGVQRCDTSSSEGVESYIKPSTLQLAKPDPSKTFAEIVAEETAAILVENEAKAEKLKKLEAEHNWACKIVCKGMEPWKEGKWVKNVKGKGYTYYANPNYDINAKPPYLA
jgi:hypothetical protein